MLSTDSLGKVTTTLTDSVPDQGQNEEDKKIAPLNLYNRASQSNRGNKIETKPKMWYRNKPEIDETEAKKIESFFPVFVSRKRLEKGSLHHPIFGPLGPYAKVFQETKVEEIVGLPGYLGQILAREFVVEDLKGWHLHTLKNNLMVLIEREKEKIKILYTTLLSLEESTENQVSFDDGEEYNDDEKENSSPLQSIKIQLQRLVNMAEEYILRIQGIRHQIVHVQKSNTKVSNRLKKFTK